MGFPETFFQCSPLSPYKKPPTHLYLVFAREFYLQKCLNVAPFIKLVLGVRVNYKHVLRNTDFLTLPCLVLFGACQSVEQFPGRQNLGHYGKVLFGWPGQPQPTIFMLN